MRNFDRRVASLEMSFSSNQSDFSHLSDHELDEFIEEELGAAGYRLAHEGEFVKVPEIDPSLLLAEVSSLTNEELDIAIQHGCALDGYVLVEGIN